MTQEDYFFSTLAVLSARFEVGVSLLLAPVRADKRAQRPFSSSGKCRNTDGDSQESTRRSSSGSRVLLKALLWVGYWFIGVKAETQDKCLPDNPLSLYAD